MIAFPWVQTSVLTRILAIDGACIIFYSYFQIFFIKLVGVANLFEAWSSGQLDLFGEHTMYNIVFIIV